MPWRGGSGGRRSFFPWRVFLAGLAALLLPAETLDLTVKPVVTAFLNNDTSLPCTISGYSTPELDIQKMAVTWYLKTTGRNDKKTVYSVIAGVHNSVRNGAHLDIEKLKKGDATLSLPQIQLNENGTYICSVTVTPDRVDRMTDLETVAKPDINLSPKILTIERDKEKTISCAINKFYPGEIVVLWEKNSKHTADKSVPAEDICTGSSVKNEYGTFNVTSKLKLQPSLQDDGNIYSCIVKHKSFSLDPVHSVTLAVTEPPGNNIWIAWLVAVISLIIMMAIFVYFRWFKKIPPTTMAFVGNNILKHSEENNLQCLFSGFRPMSLELNYFLIEPNKEKEKIFSWNTKAASDPEQGDENLALLKKQMFIFNQTLSKTKMHTSVVSAKVMIVPDVKKLPEFELSVEIKHVAFPQGLFATIQHFQVISQPLLGSVQCSTDEPKPNEPLTLTCNISRYFPKEIETSWWKDDERVSEQTSLTESIKGSDGLFSCSSSIKFSPKAEDIGKTFFCKARLKSEILKQNLNRESGWTLNTLVFPPKVSHIECKPSEPEFGKPITLSCVVRDFYPPECDICWKKGLKKLTDSTSEFAEPDPASKLYNGKSQVSFIPNPKDHGVDFVVEINHCNKITQNKYSLMLKGFPKVADISLDPSSPEYGCPLCLSCEVMNFYPGDIDIQWLDGDNLIMNGVDTEKPVIETNGCFHLTSRYQLKPTASDYNKSISIKVKHEKLAKPITKSVYLNLPAKLPVLSEIKATRPSSWSKDIILEISISDFAPSDIRVTWYKDWKKLAEDTNLRTVLIGENKLCYMTSQITVDPKEEDIGKTIRCEVYHPATSRVQEKSFVLKGRDSFDNTEKISPSHVNRNHIGPSRNSRSVNEELMNSMKIECDTSSPTAGQKVTLHCFVPGKDADGAAVFWYKGIYPVEQEIQNTNCEDGTGFISNVTVETKKGEQECEIRCEVYGDDENLEESYILKLN